MDIKIYTLSYCPYCAAAKNFFDEKNLKYTEYQMDGNEDEEFSKLARDYGIKGEVTAPQIIIDGKRIGGYSDLMELASEDKISF
ncbi:MAG: glutaredoxin domain-containing protein [bacterium]|nr:glutaredoxin domain-containing protein [bacterium]